MGMRAMLIAAVVFGTTPASLIAAPPSALDAPIKPSTPTLGSEIKRGESAVFQCSTDYDSTLQFQSFARCVDDQELANRNEMKSGYEAYDTGLYFAARTYAQITLNVLSEHSVPAVGVQEMINAFDIGYHENSKAFHLTDEQVRIAAFGK